MVEGEEVEEEENGKVVSIGDLCKPEKTVIFIHLNAYVCNMQFGVIKVI